ncbi:AAA family ATPase [Methylomagnum sp.]
MIDLAPNLAEARRFLEVLDEGAEAFTFQTFDDDKDRKARGMEEAKQRGEKDRDPYARILHGTLEQHAAKLTELQAHGAGVFVMVQEGDGHGRTNANVTRIRAVFIEDDGDSAGREYPLEPHLIVESSPGKRHVYFLVDGLTVPEFRGVQERLIADWGSDKNAKDPARVLRVPGFWHLKNRAQPHQVRILHESGLPPHSRDRLLAAFPPLEKPQATRPPRQHGGDIVEGGRNAYLTTLAGAMRRRDASEVAILTGLLAENTARCNPPLPDAEVKAIVRSVGRYEAAPRVDSPIIPHQPEPIGAINILDWSAAHRFQGEPPEREWLVPGKFPLGKPALLASAGGVGKSFLLVELARAVAGAMASCALGDIESHGAAVVLCAEDDAIEIHTRLASLGAIPERLFIIPCPDAGGTPTLFTLDERGRPTTTPHFRSLAEQLRSIPDLRLFVPDPLQALCGGLDLNLPQHAQHVCNELARLAAETGAAVIVSHHFRKSGEIATPEQAREAIRGTGGLVDGVRSVYALWPAGEDDAKSRCRALGVEWQRGRVVMGGIVKANFGADLALSVLVREDSGVLRDRRAELGLLTPSRHDLHAGLLEAVALAAANRQPFTKTGQAGLFNRRHELPTGFHSVARHKLEALAQDLLNAGKMVQCRLKPGEKPPGTWLDIPGGGVAQESERFLKADLPPPEKHPTEDPPERFQNRFQDPPFPAFPMETPNFGNAEYEANQSLNHFHVSRKTDGLETQNPLINQAFPDFQKPIPLKGEGSVPLSGNASRIIEGGL